MEIALKGKHGNGKHCLVSNHDYERLKGIRLHMLRSGYVLLYDKLTKKNMYLHRYLFQEELKANTKLVVDHINHCKSDCRRENLRLITQQENLCNRRKISFKTSSQYKGVCRTLNDKWVALITLHGKRFYIGTYNDERDAAIAYNLKAIELHKGYALLNTIH